MTSVYPFVFTLGVVAGLLWLTIGDQPTKRDSRLDAGLSALAGGVLGARVGYVVTHLTYFTERPVEALWFSQGGLSWVGGLLGALAGLSVFALVTHQPLRPLADALALPAAMMSVAAWAGCLFDGCAYGRRTQAGPFAPPAPDIFGWFAPRWPTQAVGLLVGLVGTGLIYWLLGQRAAPGVAASLSIAWIAAGALGLAFTRGDPSPLLWGIRLDALAAAAILVLSFIAWGVCSLRR